MNYDRTLTHEQLTEAVREIRPSWEVTGATPAAHGHHIVYILDVETETGERRAVLKSTPEGKSPVCGTEARMQAILDAHTSIPVPTVFGVVDEHDTLPAPYLLQSHLDGANYRGDDIRDFSTADVERLARTTGRYLAELHALDAVDAYGFVGIDPADTPTGRPPSSDLGQIVVEDATDSWEAYVQDSMTQVVDALETTRFADLRHRIEPIAESYTADLTGEFRPVVARVDNSLDNLLLDPETCAVTGMLDWEFTVSATPAYDVAFVVHSLVDSFWSLLPETPTHRTTAKRSLLAGYRAVGPARVIEQYGANGPCYDLLALVHSMLNFDDWFDLVGIHDERRDDAANRLRTRLERYD